MADSGIAVGQDFEDGVCIDVCIKNDRGAAVQLLKNVNAYPEMKQIESQSTILFVSSYATIVLL